MNQQNKIQTKVPSWDDGFNHEVEFAPSRNKKFYYYLVDEILKGNFLDIEGNTYYITLYLRSVVQQFVEDKDIKILLERFEKISQAYGNYLDIKNQLLSWKGQSYLYLKDYDKGWFFLRQRFITIQDIIDIRSKCRETFIDGQDLIKMFGSKLYSKNGLTKFGKNNIESLLKIISINLDAFHKRYGKNFVEYFCQQFDFANLSNVDFLRLSEFFTDEKDFILLKKTYELREIIYYLEKEKYSERFQYKLFNGAVNYSPYINCKAIPSIILTAIENRSKRMIRECENTLREEMSVPRIGEGWIGETELFYKLQEYFSNERIITHARPIWLALQHLDIYFPDRNIGIEYQGLQHQKPVEYFGGLKAFEKQKERDKRKMQLCNENNCKLIYVYEGYCFDDVIKSIKSLFETK